MRDLIKDESVARAVIVNRDGGMMNECFPLHRAACRMNRSQKER
jgi:hypothetical protein